MDYTHRDRMDTKMRVVEEEEEEETTPIYGDVLEAVLSFVPLTDLVPVCRVSKNWRRSVFTSLHNFNKPKPWLIVQTQSTRSYEAKTMHAYDPRSDVWIEIDKPETKYVSTLRSFGSNFVYVLSSSTLLFSDDPFNLNWRQIKGPTVCRSDPIVALCGGRVVVAGSCWQFEDELLAVEVYDPHSATWRTCQSIPEILKDADAAAWLSVAADDAEMIVTEKASGITYSFDPCAGEWRGPYDLRPDPQAYFSTIGFAGEDLIVAGLIGSAGKPERLRICKVNRETMACEPICDAPAAILKKLRGSKEILRQIEVSPAKGFFYMYNPWEPEEIVFCEFVSGDCVWGSTRNVAWTLDVKIGGKVVFTCGRVEIADLQAAMKSGNRKFLTNY